MEDVCDVEQLARCFGYKDQQSVIRALPSHVIVEVGARGRHTKVIASEAVAFLANIRDVADAGAMTEIFPQDERSDDAYQVWIDDPQLLSKWQEWKRKTARKSI